MKSIEVGISSQIVQKPKIQRSKGPKTQKPYNIGISRLKREPGQARALAKMAEPKAEPDGDQTIEGS